MLGGYKGIQGNGCKRPQAEYKDILACLLCVAPPRVSQWSNGNLFACKSHTYFRRYKFVKMPGTRDQIPSSKKGKPTRSNFLDNNGFSEIPNALTAEYKEEELMAGSDCSTVGARKDFV